MSWWKRAPEEKETWLIAGIGEKPVARSGPNSFTVWT